MEEPQCFLFEVPGLLLRPTGVACTRAGCRSTGSRGCGSWNPPVDLAIVLNKVEKTARPLSMVGDQGKGRVCQTLPVWIAVGGRGRIKVRVIDVLGKSCGCRLVDTNQRLRCLAEGGLQIHQANGKPEAPPYLLIEKGLRLGIQIKTEAFTDSHSQCDQCPDGRSAVFRSPSYLQGVSLSSFFLGPVSSHTRYKTNACKTVISRVVSRPARPIAVSQATRASANKSALLA